MAGFYYQQSGYPAYGSASSSTLERSELQSIQAGFDKLPTPTGNANAIVRIKSDASGLDVTSATLSATGVLGNITGMTNVSGTWDFTGVTALLSATPTVGDSSTKVATTAFVATSFAPKASPAFTGTPTAPTATPLTNTTQLATTAYADAAVAVEAAARSASDALLAPLVSPALTGTPTAPTATAGTSTTQIATTAFVMSQAFSGVLPAQTGNAGKFVTTDGVNASWASIPPATGSTLYMATNFGAM